MILLDTNVLSELMRPAPNRNVLIWVDELNRVETYTSAINRAEILQGIELLSEGKRKQHLVTQAKLMFQLFDSRILPFTSHTAPLYAQIVSSRQRVGKPIHLQDAQIAATALENNAVLATRNEKDFLGIKNLNIFNPWVG